ncbi:uncharacterized protein PFL1_05919 [Pseudozyma flocculosa PF-1]|uniref:Related to Aquaporin 3 n=2 Tax=Pseudozyma flocculosa TaxID=84751 RepID=A0A5C3F3Z0_9BASI|nr:uncharacterized protein PFL1_05919 [Pseudozyma flocculosa PF-1]EPQ26598.1 hypothetical protein PFL1_05919 [Pseudozyma flocculosa PF-1]SPO38407.1 related to Aquaporin 3 [Pseudozyma flocculosa]
MSETNPLLAGRDGRSPSSSSSTHARSRPSFNLGVRRPSHSYRRPSRSDSLSNAEVHPDPNHVEPLLPASAPHPDQETRLHRPKWWRKDYLTGEPNEWAKFRYIWREEFAEFWGTFMILLFGAGVECQVNLHYASSVRTSSAFGSYLSGRLAWAAGVSIASWVSGGISGGHCNPTVTLCLSLYRGFPLRKVPWFILSQLLGATAASLVVYFNYFHSISLFEGGSASRTVVGPHATAPLFFTFPAPYLPWYSAFYSEFLASATLVMAIFALSDKSNLAPPKGTQPFAVFLVLLAIGSSLGFDTGYAINGARDTGPRIALWLVGYGSRVWTHDGFYWLWAPWIASISGGTLGAALYDLFIYTGRDSPVNRPRVDRASLDEGGHQPVFGGVDEED